MECSFAELRCKEVINVVNGKCLGNIIDIIFDRRCGKLLGFVVPGNKTFFAFFKSCDDLFIPYNNVCKIGDDTILVEIYECCNQKSSACSISDEKDSDKNYSDEKLKI